MAVNSVLPFLPSPPGTKPTPIPGEEEQFGMLDVPTEVCGTVILLDSLRQQETWRNRKHLVQPKFLAMRRMLFEFKQQRLHFDEINEGDLVDIPKSYTPMDGPWICMGKRGGFMYRFATMDGCMLDIPTEIAPFVVTPVHPLNT